MLNGGFVRGRVGVFGVGALLAAVSCGDGRAPDVGMGGTGAGGAEPASGGAREGTPGTGAASSGAASAGGRTGAGGSFGEVGGAGSAGAPPGSGGLGGTATSCGRELSRTPNPNDAADCRWAARLAARQCDGDRICLHAAYEQLCATDRADVLIEMYACQDRTCRTFSDANDAVACLRDLHAARSTEQSRRLDEALFKLCPSSYPDLGPNGAGYTEFTSVMLDPVRIDCVVECLDSASTCEEAAPCLIDNIPGAAAAYDGSRCEAPIELLPLPTDWTKDYEAACLDEIDPDNGCTRCWPAARELCSFGNPEAVLGMAWCLATGSCWSEFDSNTAGPCMDQVIERHGNSDVDAVRAKMLALGCQQHEVRGFTALATEMSDEDRALFAACIGDLGTGDDACSTEASTCLAATHYDASLCEN